MGVCACGRKEASKEKGCQEESRSEEGCSKEVTDQEEGSGEESCQEGCAKEDCKEVREKVRSKEEEVVTCLVH